jgi:hypothetical protein
MDEVPLPAEYLLIGASGCEAAPALRSSRSGVCVRGTVAVLVSHVALRVGRLFVARGPRVAGTGGSGVASRSDPLGPAWVAQLKTGYFNRGGMSCVP